MTIPLSEEQRAFRTAAERFAREKLAPHYQAREQEAAIDRKLVREMGALGLIGADLPERHGGLGLPSETTGLIIEALAYGDFNVAYVQLLGSLCGQIIARHGDDDARRANGCRASFRAKASFRSRSPSRAAARMPPISPCRPGPPTRAMCSTARSPRSAWPTRPMPRWSLPAPDNVEDGARGVSAFLVPMNAPGVTTSRFSDLGSKAVGRGSIFFDDVEVPRANRLGGGGRRFRRR